MTREPLVIFVVLGAVLAALMAAVRPATPVDTINVRLETIRAIVGQNEALLGRPLTDDEILTMVEDHVDEEVLLREARIRGLDETDVRVRKRLLAVMRTALDEPVAEPTVAELEAYYREHAERLRSAPSITFEHAYFAWGSDRVPADPTAFIERLETADEPTSLGDASPAGHLHRRADRGAQVLRFGREFADAVANLTPNAWSGPIESRSGVHYVRVLETHEPRLQPFADIEPYLRQEWMFDRQRALQAKKLETLRDKYRIVLPDASP